MLRKALYAALVASLIAACSHDATDAPAPLPRALEASYTLSFNDELVGRALFSLDVAADGAYRLSAFTTPAGELQRQGPHEVLETSRGVIGDAGVLPQAYTESVLSDGVMQLSTLTFDRARKTLHIDAPDGDRSAALLPGTHDRLSYLLAARQLAADGAGVRAIRIVTPDAIDATRLAIAGKQSASLPGGAVDVIRIARETPGEDDTRELWFAPQQLALPLRILHRSDAGDVVMKLVGVRDGGNGAAHQVPVEELD